MLSFLVEHCLEKSHTASAPEEFEAVSQGIASFLSEERSLDLHRRAVAEKKKGNAAGAAAHYLLSSFAEDTTLGRAVVQHALVAHDYSGRISRRSVLWTLLANQLTLFWNAALDRTRFKFSNPDLIQDELSSLTQLESQTRLKRLLQVIVGGLSIRIPKELKTTSDWLHQRE
jgi:hypothetical protein